MRPVLRRPSVVPYIAAWSSEWNVSPPVVHRGFGIGYADEVPQDRDEHGVVWARNSIRPKSGRPDFGRVHALRQRRAMRRLLCQVCGEPADRDTRGTLWIVEDARGDWPDWPERMVTAHPPVCLPCAHLAVEECPHLQEEGWVALRVQAPRIDGVHGMRYQRGMPLPQPGKAETLPYEDNAVRWVQASHQTQMVRGCTVVDLARETATARRP